MPRTAPLLLALAALLLPAVSRADEPVKVSVMYFENRTGQADYEALRKGLADMMVTDITSYGGVTVLERGRLEEVLRELRLQHTTAFDPTHRRKVGKLLGAEYLVMGVINLTGGMLVLDATLVEVQSGTVRIGVRAAGAPDHIFDIEQDLVQRLMTGIKATLSRPERRRGLKVPDLRTLVDYGRAVELADAGKLAEAGQAMQLVVSRSPAFIMARERRQAILRDLETAGQRRQAVQGDAASRLLAHVEAGVKTAVPFDRLDDGAQRRVLGFRVLRGRLLGRLLRAHVSSRSRSLRLVLPGHEAQALQLMRTIADNGHRLANESHRQRQAPYGGVIDPDTTNLAARAQVKVTLRPAHQEVIELGRFVLLGRVDEWNDGSDGGAHHGFTVGPALGNRDAAERAAIVARLEALTRKATAALGTATANDQFQFRQVLERVAELKADALVRADQDDAAVQVLQKFLDAVPTGVQVARVEQRIKELVGAHASHEHATRERWAKALTGCVDMDIRVGDATLERQLRRYGLAGLARHAAELEKACKGKPGTESAFAFVYQHLAHAAVEHDDCASYQRWLRKQVEYGGSVTSILAFHKRFSWCSLADVIKHSGWLQATLDEHWTLDLTRQLVSVRAHSGQRLSLTASGEGTPEQLSLYLDATPQGWVCKLAQLHRRGGERLKGTCQVVLTHEATRKHDFDEGTFSAEFEAEGPRGPRKLRLTKGEFRLRRQ